MTRAARELIAVGGVSKGTALSGGDAGNGDQQSLVSPRLSDRVAPRDGSDNGSPEAWRDHRRLKLLAVRTGPFQLCRMVIEVRGRKDKVDGFVLEIGAGAFRIIGKSKDLDMGLRPQGLAVAEAHACLSARASGERVRRERVRLPGIIAMSGRPTAWCWGMPLGRRLLKRPPSPARGLRGIAILWWAGLPTGCADQEIGTPRWPDQACRPLSAFPPWQGGRRSSGQPG